jgi:hypothetical protein
LLTKSKQVLYTDFRDAYLQEALLTNARALT